MKEEYKSNLKSLGFSLVALTPGIGDYYLHKFLSETRARTKTWINKHKEELEKLRNDKVSNIGRFFKVEECNRLEDLIKGHKEYIAVSYAGEIFMYALKYLYTYPLLIYTLSELLKHKS